jgi:hypothetical protein
MGRRSARCVERLRGAPELSDPVGSLEVGEAQNVEQFDAGSGTEGTEALSESALKSRYAPPVSV